MASRAGFIPKTPDDREPVREKRQPLARRCTGQVRRIVHGWVELETTHPSRHLKTMYLRPLDMADVMPIKVGMVVHLRYIEGSPAGSWYAHYLTP